VKSPGYVNNGLPLTRYVMNATRVAGSLEEKFRCSASVVEAPF